MTTAQRDRLYYCPGESYPISFSVHLARLTAAYPKCRDCPLRHQAGHLHIESHEALHGVDAPASKPSLLSRQGVRGVYLNELTRRDAGEYAAAFAEWLSRRTDDPHRPLQLAIGYQEHTASPDLLVGVVNALRRCGVQMIEIGLTTPPAFSFAVRQLEAGGGVLITNAGATAAEIGLDFVLSSGEPLRDEFVLRSIEQTKDAGIAWRSGTLGGYRTFMNQTQYENSLTPWFHALRPLTLVLATPLRLIREHSERLFQNLPCTLRTLELGQRLRDLRSAADVDVLKVSNEVQHERADFGFLIDSDGRSVAVVDESGTFVERRVWSQIISCITSPGTVQTVSETGEVWFAGEPPVSDGILTLAQLLQTLSRSDEPLSRRVTE